MVAIETKFIPPTNHRGARVKAFTESGLSVTIPWEHGDGVEANHVAAAQALAHKMDWAGFWVGGGTKRGWAFVNSRAAQGASFDVKR